MNMNYSLYPVTDVYTYLNMLRPVSLGPPYVTEVHIRLTFRYCKHVIKTYNTNV
jgi:hypothetical protein